MAASSPSTPRYKVVFVRLSSEPLQGEVQKSIDAACKEGWRLFSVTGPTAEKTGGHPGVLLVFER